MSYTPTEWQPDDIVAAARMNSLETAVGEINMSYTPNTWVNGDVITAAKMNALEQAVASGGGGSSDFSTAEVTVVLNAALVPTCYAPVCVDYIDEEYPEDNYSASETVLLVPGTFTMPLYKGECRLTMDTGRTITGTGSVEIYEGILVLIVITGDCTITIS